MSEPIVPHYIESQGSKYVVAASIDELPSFPDIPRALHDDIGDLLVDLVEKLPPDKADIIRRSLLPVFSESHATIEVELSGDEAPFLWASFSPDRCKEIAAFVVSDDLEFLRPFLVSGKQIEYLNADNVLDIIEEALNSFWDAAGKGCGLAFLRIK